MNDRPAWYVWTTICDCNKVAASIFSGNMVSDEAWEAHFHGQPFDDADPERETSRSGDDWRPLLTEAVSEMARRIGLLISSNCTAVYVRDPAQNEAISNEAAEILYTLQDAQLATGPTKTSP